MKWVNFFLLIFLTGCLVGPNYKPPSHIPQQHWSSPFDPSLVHPEMPPPVNWWALFQDPLLEKYIELAAFNNQDLAAAEMAICQARAIRKVTAADLFPQIAVDLNATRTYFSKNGPVFAITSGQTNAFTGLPFQLQIPQIQNLYNGLIDASWEIDLFGKIRRAVEAAEANIGSAIEHRNDLLITLLAEVAINYMELRSYQQKGQLLEENMALLETNARIIRKQLKAGYTNALNLERIEAEVAQLVAQLPAIHAQIYQTIYALSVLTGNVPEALLCELMPIQSLPVIPEQIAIGLRSDLIRRRPDIRQAERQLAAATANIGVAVASFFPSFTLNGDIGLQSISLSNFFQARSLTWALGGNIHIPIFQGGRLQGNLLLAKSKACEAFFHYAQTVLNALQEAESALVAFTGELEAASELLDAVQRYQRIVFLSSERHTKGLVNLIDFVDSERQLNNSQQNLLTSQTKALIDLIALFKALGGGWQPVCSVL